MNSLSGLYTEDKMPLLDKIEKRLATIINNEILKGGSGSGNFGHEGRPGEVGGSGPGGGGSASSGNGGSGGGGKTGKEWHHSLNKGEKESLDRWTTHAGSIRHYQKTRSGSAQTKETAKNLESALAKDGSYEGVVWRGAGCWNEEDYNNLVNSKIIKFNAFASSSKDVKIATRFARTKGRSILFKINCKTGVDISSISAMSKEQEVILKNKTRYRVTGSSKKATYTRIDLEEI